MSDLRAHCLARHDLAQDSSLLNHDLVAWHLVAHRTVQDHLAHDYSTEVPMDPDEVLAQYRAELELAQLSDRDHRPQRALTHYAAAAQAMEHLDRWLTDGGFLPRAWVVAESAVIV